MSVVPLRVAAVSYLNAVPLVWGLSNGPHREKFEVVAMLPSKCADELAAGRFQAGIIPSIEYQRISDLEIVPKLCIGSSGPVRSVIMIARSPIEQIRAVALDTSSRTSACLLQILLKRHFRIQPRLIPQGPDTAQTLRDCEAALLIGDPALATDFPQLDVYDLADHWRMLTGLPFVFAFWAVRREVASRAISSAFRESKEYAMQHLEEIICEETKRTGLSAADVRTYLTENIDFNLEGPNLEGLQRFYALAHEMGLIDQLKPIKFIDD